MHAKSQKQRTNVRKTNHNRLHIATTRTKHHSVSRHRAVSARRISTHSTPLSSSRCTVHKPHHINKTSTFSMSSSASSQKPFDLYAKAVIIPPKGEHKRTVFFLHGLGDRGQSFVDVFSHLQLHNTKVILPNAPIRPITANGGYAMPGWYDIRSFGGGLAERGEDESGINQSTAALLAAIDQEAALLNGDYTKIALGGFSQGSAISQHVAARCSHTLAGVLGFSGYALLSTPQHRELFTNVTTPYYLYHGEDDDVVKFEYGEMTNQFWQDLGNKNVTFQSEPDLGHGLSHQALVHMKKWFSAIGFD